MAFKTFEALVQDAISALGEVEGTSVQTYSEPRVEVALNHIFEFAFRKVWWPQYMTWYEKALDGTLGVLTTDFSPAVVDIRDIRAIIPENEEKSLPRLPPFKNPFNTTGTTVRYWEGLNNTSQFFDGRLLQFWPKTATGNIKIHARNMPTVTNSTTLYIDEKLLVNGTAWTILEDEDINPNAAALRERLFNEAFADIIKQYGEHPEETGYIASADYRTQWQV